MASNSGSLPLPPEAQLPDARELLHVWDVRGNQHVALTPQLGGSPKEFGQLLAQIALHAAAVYERNAHRPKADCLREILTGFKEEVSKNVGH